MVPILTYQEKYNHALLLKQQIGRITAYATGLNHAVFPSRKQLEDFKGF
jgi:hypothetical protein